MKRILLIPILIAALTDLASAQLLSSIFDQQGTKKKDMAEQVTLIETGLGEVKNGYKITENGLTTIHDLKHGTFSLHTNYFLSLMQVNSAIVKDPKVKAILDDRQNIINVFENLIGWQKQHHALTNSEIDYIVSVYNNLLKLCNDDVGELNDVVTPGKLQMKDEQRLAKIDALYTDMQDKYSFARSFADKMYALAKNRMQRTHESQVLKQLYNLN